MKNKDCRVERISTPNAPTPGGHYSQAVAYNGTLYISGQLPINPFTGEINSGSIEEQTQQTLDNINTILKDSGSDKSKVLKMTVYISDISLWGRVNEVYSDFFGKYKPARAVIPTAALHNGALIEIEAVAAV